MDEESIVGKDTIVGIVNFIRGSRSTGELIGQGKTTAKTMEHTLPQNNIQNPAKPHINPTYKTMQIRQQLKQYNIEAIYEDNQQTINQIKTIKP